jgi:hypothetical protein
MSAHLGDPFMCDMGQSSSPGQPSWHPDGIPWAGVIEIITADSAARGHGTHIAGETGPTHRKISAARTGGARTSIEDPETDQAGVG